ncbi:hypothetical protein D4R42_01475 [bacterium]|nr:MAG: hypothetical protein D4R42_01475 [bacterium]
MNGGFVKIYSDMLTSSIWNESDKVRVLWITMLAMSDAKGVVRSALTSLGHMARLNNKAELLEALSVLEGPDEESRTELYEGRRVAKIEGGWQILNFEKYRNGVINTPTAERNRDRVRKFREKKSKELLPQSVTKHEETLRNVTVTDGNATLHVSASASASASASEDGECEGKTVDVMISRLHDLGATDITPEIWIKINRAYPGADRSKVVLELEAWAEKNEAPVRGWYSLIMGFFSTNEATRIKRGLVDKTGKDIEPAGSEMPDYLKKADAIKDPEERRAYLAELQDEGKV